MQYFQGPKTKQILGRSAVERLADLVVVAPAAAAFDRSWELADVVLVAPAADPDGAAASAPAPTTTATRTASTSILSVFIIPPFPEPPYAALWKERPRFAELIPQLTTRRWPREESNLRTQLRRLPLCPLSYGARGERSAGRRTGIDAVTSTPFGHLTVSDTVTAV
jgi:hypothetical protein